MNKVEYLFQCLQEECNEVGQAVSWAVRFGLDDKYDGQEDNKTKIHKELNDLLAVVTELQKLDAIPFPIMDYGLIIEKQVKIQTYMQYSKDRGHLVDDPVV